MGEEREYVKRLKKTRGKGKGTAVKHLDRDKQQITTDRPRCLLTLDFYGFSRLAPHGRIFRALTVVPMFYSYFFVPFFWFFFVFLLI